MSREELTEIEDIYENDEFVLMKATYKPSYEKIIRISVGIKDKTGDILKMIDICEKYL